MTTIVTVLISVMIGAVLGLGAGLSLNYDPHRVSVVIGPRSGSVTLLGAVLGLLVGLVVA